MSEQPLKRFVISARGGRVVSFDEEYGPPSPLVEDDDGRIVFLDITRTREVANYPRSQFESAHAALSWLLVLGRKEWFTKIHLLLLLHRLGVGLPTVDGICDPARTSCTPPAEPESKGGAT